MRPEIVDKVRRMAEARRAGGSAAVGELEPWSCDETPPPLFYIGLEQFNRGEYFEQHESLEEIWILEPRPRRVGGSAVGRELDPGARHDPPPPPFPTGLEQYTRRHFFEQHESLEEIWIRAPRPLHSLYQGFLNFGVNRKSTRLNPSL